MPRDALGPQIRGGAAMAHHARMDPVLARDQRGSGGQAGGIGAVVPVEPDAFPGDGIHMRGGIPTVAIASHMVGTERVDVEDDDPHSILLISPV